jgi:uncharacterized Zn-binding protein involved in type VI secretion
MPAVQRQGDSDTGGGKILSGVGSVRTNGIPTATINLAVSWHGKKAHSGPKTTTGVSSVRVEGQPISVAGNPDTCGHTRTGGSGDVRAG